MKILTDNKIRALFCKMTVYLIIFTALSIIIIMFWAKDSGIYILGVALVMSVMIFLSCYGFFKEQYRMIENAEAQITEYISGNKSVRIECDEEGELYKLFHRINCLAAILNAHAEKEVKSKEFLKNTISDISHQLKTPLAALSIYNGIMQDETTELSDVREFTHLSEQELDRIEGLVQNLLKITKLDAGTIVPDRTVQNVSEMLQDVKRHFVFRAEQEDKQISLTGEENISLLCDRDWLTQALDNLVKNAFDHTDKGGRVCMESRQFASMVQIMVKDNGSGIHPEDLPHIFKRFYRSRFSMDTQGIGLGLPLVKAIIEAHNGSIEVDSTLGQGTTFTLNFLI